MTETQENKLAVWKHVQRLTAKPFAPADTKHPQYVEIGRVLVECCESPGHAKVLIDAVMREEGAIPEPARFRRMARESREMCQRPDPFCGDCGGSGYTSQKHGEYEYSGLCSCWGSRPVKMTPWDGEIESSHMASEARA